LFCQAADGGHIEILRSLGDNGIRLDQKDNKGRTVAHHGKVDFFLNRKKLTLPSLHLAASNDHCDVLRFLAEQGIHLDIKDNEERSPLFYGKHFQAPRLVYHLVVN
jgi:ankyrin repeat protein